MLKNKRLIHSIITAACVMLMFVAPSYGQWKVYDGSILPSATTSGGDSLDFPKLSDNSPGADFTEKIVDDADIAGNKLLEYLQPNGKLRYRHNFSSTFTGTHFTIAARLKGTGDTATYDRICDIEWQNGNSGTRDELRISPIDSTIDLSKSGNKVKVNMDLNAWHIYRIQVMGDSSAVFIDEDTIPVVSAKTTSSASSMYFKFGDGSGDAIGGYIDWVICAEDTAATPQQMALPDTLTGQEWNGYAADVMPLDFSNDFSESNVDTNDTHTCKIMVDPDNANNNLLEMLIPDGPSGQKLMYKYNFADDCTAMTLVARVKSVEGYDRSTELDLQQGGFRERLYIKSDNTFELKESKIKGKLPNTGNWHIFRITKDADKVKVYVDEKPEPIAEATTTTTSTSKYFRFGDGNGSSSVGGLVDYVVWSTKGAFAPDELAIPEGYSNVYVDGDATLKELTVSAGTLVPDFDPLVTSYAVNYDYSQVSSTITAVPNSDRATVEGAGAYQDMPGTAVIKVTAEDSTVMEYTIHYPAVNDSTLAELAVSSGTLTPDFDPAVSSYTVELTADVDTVTITGKANSEFAKVSGLGDFTSLPGTDTITVTAFDGTINSYTIAFSYIPLSSDNTLKDLSVDVGTLDPAFSSEVFEYAVKVPQGTASINITATVNDTTATVSGDGAFSTIPGTATITVTAENGDTQDYTIAVDFEVGISSTENLVSVYPNPMNNQLNVNVTDYNTSTVIEIFNALGVVVQEIPVQQQNTTVDVSAYKSGIYLVQIKNLGSIISSKLVVK